MKSSLLILGHLGLGDHIVCNAIYRHYALLHDVVCIPVKYHNIPSVTFMLRDLDNVLIRPVEDDDEALVFYQRVWKGAKLGLGCFGDSFNGQIWDQEFYRQADLGFQLRWSGWKCVREDEEAEVPAQNPYWTFVHDDIGRGMEIRREATPVVRPINLGHIFKWWGVIELAPEIHCICSSFALFIDSIDLPKNPKLFLHSYCRPGEPLPTFRKDWKIFA